MCFTIYAFKRVDKGSITMGERKNVKRKEGSKLNPKVGIKHFSPSNFQYSKGQRRDEDKCKDTNNTEIK